MIEITFNELPRTIKRALQIFEVPLSNALNKTAPIILTALREEMKQVFDKPTPYALNGFRVIYSKPANPLLIIKLKDEAVRGGARAVNFLGPEIIGGDRSRKRSEEAFSVAGKLNKSSFLVPGKGAKMDQYGNISRQEMQKILAQTKTARDIIQRTSSKTKKKKNSSRFFLGAKNESGDRIVFQGISGKAIPILIPVKKVNYKKRFDFFGIAGKSFDDNIETIYDQEVLKFAESFIP